MKTISEQIKEKPWKGWVLFFLTILVVFCLGLLASSIMERRTEAVFAYTPKWVTVLWNPEMKYGAEIFPVSG